MGNKVSKVCNYVRMAVEMICCITFMIDRRGTLPKPSPVRGPVHIRAIMGILPRHQARAQLSDIVQKFFVQRLIPCYASTSCRNILGPN